MASVVPVDLRHGGAADLGTVERLMQQAFDPRFGEAWSRSQCLGILALPGVWLTLAEVDARPVGFALSRMLGLDEAELLLLATIPERRRTGVGQALLRSVEADARDRGAGRLFLEVREGNGAMHLYRRAGFTQVGHRRAYYKAHGRNFDAFTFARDL